MQRHSYGVTVRRQKHGDWIAELCLTGHVVRCFGATEADARRNLSRLSGVFTLPVDTTIRLWRTNN